MQKLVVPFAFLACFALGIHARAGDETVTVEKIYADNCASCHGKSLEGGSGPSLIDDEWVHGSSDSDIAKTIQYGFPTMGMPAWAAMLDQDTIRSLVIFIREQKAVFEKDGIVQSVEPKSGVFSSLGYRFKMEDVAYADGVVFSFTFLPDGDILASLRNGSLVRIPKGKSKGEKIEGIPKVWFKGQGGLLEVQLHPQYKKNHWIYLSYSEDKGATDQDKPAAMTAVVRGKLKRDRWVEQQTLFSVDKSKQSSQGMHFGSRFVFKDGYLYFGMGDRGYENFAQDLSRPNGKIFRLFDDGRIPEDNPFVGVEGAMPEIWSYGHRNPQGLDIEPATGLIWETEHGPRGGDEVNVIAKGRNYGWPVITYGMNYDGTPITEKTHQVGMEQPQHYWVPSIATSGIEFYEGDLFDRWKGKLLISGMVSQELRLLTVDGAKVIKDELVLKGQGRVRDVASGPDGAIYLSLDQKGGKGKIVRLSPAE